MSENNDGSVVTVLQAVAQAAPGLKNLPQASETGPDAEIALLEKLTALLYVRGDSKDALSVVSDEKCHCGQDGNCQLLLVRAFLQLRGADSLLRTLKRSVRFPTAQRTRVEESVVKIAWKMQWLTSRADSEGLGRCTTAIGSQQTSAVSTPWWKAGLLTALVHMFVVGQRRGDVTRVFIDSLLECLLDTISIGKARDLVFCSVHCLVRFGCDRGLVLRASRGLPGPGWRWRRR